MADIDAALEQQISTFRSDNGNLTYIRTTSRITSGDQLKPRNGLGGFPLDLRAIQRR